MTFDVELGNTGLWYATSPDVKGLLVAGRTFEHCLSEIAPTMARMDRARQEHEAHKDAEIDFLQAAVNVLEWWESLPLAVKMFDGVEPGAIAHIRNLLATRKVTPL